MKTNKSVLWASTALVAVTFVSSMSFASVRQYGCAQTLPETVQQTVSVKDNARTPAQDQTETMSIGDKLRQARQSHHVTPSNIDCAFDSIAD